MKNVLIGGVPRSGKSILARGVAKTLGLSSIPGDPLVSALGDVFPDLGIADGDKHKRICARFLPLLERWVRHLEFEDRPFVIDLYHVCPEDVLRVAPPGRYVVLFLGYPGVDLDRKAQDIRDYARPIDWTERLPETELRELLERLEKESRETEKECRGRHIEFVDTGTEFEDSLARALSWISERIRRD